MNRPFCLSCGCIKESIQRDYCDDCVKSLVEELATLRQRVEELEQQCESQGAAIVHANEIVSRYADQLTAANERVRILREYAEAEEYYCKFDGPSGCKAAEPYDGPCECWKPRREALNAQRRAAVGATKEENANSAK